MRTIMRKRKAIMISLLGVLVLGGITSCLKTDDFKLDKVAGTNWDPNIAVPLIHSPLTIYDVIGEDNSSSISVDSTHFVTLIYKGNIYSIYGYQFLPVNDQAYTQTIPLTFSDSSTLYTAGSVVKTRTVSIPFTGSNGEQLDSIRMGAGKLTVSLSSTVSHSGILNVSIPAATLNGVAFSKDIPFSITAGLPVLVNSSYDLTGYHLDLHASGGSNHMDEIYTVTFNNSAGSSATINKSIAITSTYSNLKIGTAYGYFGQRPITVQADSLRLSIFDNSIGGTMHFDNPKMIFTIENSFGMPVSGHLNSFNALIPAGGSFAITGAPNPLPIQSPVAEGQVAITSFTLDTVNSNIATALNFNPKFINYSAQATSNVPVAATNFLLDSSQFKVDMEIDLPLHGYASGLTVQDTADFSMDNIDQIESAVFRINIKNGFPAKAFAQVYFVDSAFQKLDSLISNPADLIIQSAQIDGSGRAIAPTLVTRDEPFNKTRLQHLFSAKKILIRGVLDTKDAPGTHIYIYSDYVLDMKVGVRAQLSFRTN